MKPEWLQWYEPQAPLPSFTTILQSWDTANQSGELNDFSVHHLGVHKKSYYLLDVYRERLNYPELKRKVVELREKYNGRTVLIEDKASRNTAIQELKSGGLYGVKGYEPPPQTDKILRPHAQTAVFEAGRVFLPSRRPG